MRRDGWFALGMALMAVLASSAVKAETSPSLRITAVTAEGGVGTVLTLGHVLKVAVCVANAALDPAKPTIDLTKLGLSLGGLRASEKPSTVARKGSDCPLDPKAEQKNGSAFELSFRVEYQHAKRKDWLTVFDGRDGDRAIVGLTDEAGKPLLLVIDSAASTVVLSHLHSWELWLFILVSIGLVVGLVLLALRSNILRDSGPKFESSWRAFLDGRYAAWSAANFPPDGAVYDDLVTALSAAGDRDPVASVATILTASRTNAAAAQNAFNAQRDGRVQTIKAPYSLARLQMALWTIVVLAGLFLMYLITATIFQIPGSVLVLMGVSAATYLGARALDARAPAATANQPAAPGVPPAPASPSPPPQSVDLIMDIISDERGVALHRAQMMVWTVALISLFLAELFRRLVFVEFDDTMLGLMGISNGTYLALKAMEK